MIVANRSSFYNRKKFKIKISQVSFLLGSLEQVFYFKLGCFVTSVILLYAQARPHLELKPGPGFVLLAKVCPWSELNQTEKTYLDYFFKLCELNHIHNTLFSS